MLTGKGAAPNVDVFRSQAEVVAAMKILVMIETLPIVKMCSIKNLNRSNIMLGITLGAYV